jgi:hypothetical protein
LAERVSARRSGSKFAFISLRKGIHASTSAGVVTITGIALRVDGAARRILTRPTYAKSQFVLNGRLWRKADIEIP